MSLQRAAVIILLSLGVQTGCSERVKNQTAATPRKTASRDAMEFYETIATGSLDDLREALSKGAEVNLRGRNGETPLMVAIAAKDVEKMQLLVENGADPELTDDFNATALMHAVNWDFADGVKLLLDMGVDRGYSPKYPLKKVNYDFDLPESPLPDALKEVISEEEWKESIKAQKDSMVELGQNPTVEPTIADVQSVEVLKLFLAAGDELKLAPSEVRRSYVGLKNDGEFQSSLKEYRKYRSPRFGKNNPEVMNNPFWDDMIEMGGNAYAARDHFGDTHSLDSAVWCFDRFGSTLTPLADGRFVQIGGEHEDFYDPDFYIYNDVVIHDGQGGFNILGYPRDVFPPTDFHSATLAGDSIYIIGCLGYPEQRATETTPVFRLTLKTWKMEAVTTSGKAPSWLHDHRATFDSERNAMHVEGGSILMPRKSGELKIVPNEERYELDLEAFEWRKVP
jgi:ankyrin repeat protein